MQCSCQLHVQINAHVMPRQLVASGKLSKARSLPEAWFQVLMPYPLSTLNELDSNQLIGEPVPHQLGHAKVARANIPDLQHQPQWQTEQGQHKGE